MASIAPLSDSMSPNNKNSTQEDELRVSEDPKFALHGEIMMLIIILLFLIFLSVLLVFLYNKKNQSQSQSQSRGHHLHRHKHGSLEQDLPRKLPVAQFKAAHNLGSQQSKLQHEHEEISSTTYASISVAWIRRRIKAYCASARFSTERARNCKQTQRVLLTCCFCFCFCFCLAN